MPTLLSQTGVISIDATHALPGGLASPAQVWTEPAVAGATEYAAATAVEDQRAFRRRVIACIDALRSLYTLLFAFILGTLITTLTQAPSTPVAIVHSAATTLTSLLGAVELLAMPAIVADIHWLRTIPERRFSGRPSIVAMVCSVCAVVVGVAAAVGGKNAAYTQITAASLGLLMTFLGRCGGRDRSMALAADAAVCTAERMVRLGMVH